MVSTVVDLENSIVLNVWTTRSSEVQVNTSDTSSMSMLTPQLSFALPALYEREISPTLRLMLMSQEQECMASYFGVPDIRKIV